MFKRFRLLIGEEEVVVNTEEISHCKEFPLNEYECTRDYKTSIKLSMKNGETIYCYGTLTDVDGLYRNKVECNHD